MQKTILHMIGNSHIDPVWFWNWEEGMQEVKATLCSALDRMEEFPEFRFTGTSVLFFRWLERTAPDRFEELRRRVAEGRFELTGGWFLEPDCLLPHGESFVRQALYSQRYLKKTFGKICRIGSNVDSFGHSGTLPQILRKSGMDRYVFMRPRLETPVFRWRGNDGSEVTALSLPGEYTAWFRDKTVENIENTLARTKGWPQMACCYGVGNHGGGPTIDNIRTIQELADYNDKTELRFSTFGDFFDSLDTEALEVKTGSFEKVNAGCYSNDLEFKQQIRLAEKRLVAADTCLSLAALLRGRFAPEADEMESLWEGLLFNEFHDTMGGTCIREARDDCHRQVGAAAAGAGKVIALSVQDIANSLDTRGEGYPLLLVNPHSEAFDGLLDVEAEWFCQDELCLTDPKGNEVPCQRINTHAKVTHTTLGGRRRFLFEAKVPAGGYAVYRMHKTAPAEQIDRRHSPEGLSPYVLENEYVRARFDESTGLLCSLTEKETGYESLSGAAQWQVWTDQRDSWGGLQGRVYEDTGERFVLEAIERVEEGPLRCTVRAVYTHGPSRLTQLWRLGAHDRFLTVENDLVWNEPWHLLKMAFPCAGGTSFVRAEGAYGLMDREIADEAEYCMHRFADVRGKDGAGLCVANDSHYAFHCADGMFHLTAVRSPIWSQGNSPEWENPQDTYQYVSLGEHRFTLTLRPHAASLPVRELRVQADKTQGMIEYLADSWHSGAHREMERSLYGIDAQNVTISLIKRAEDGGGFVVRMLETEGMPCRAVLRLGDTETPLSFGPYELKTVKFEEKTTTFREVDLLEWDAETGKNA